MQSMRFLRFFNRLVFLKYDSRGAWTLRGSRASEAPGPLYVLRPLLGFDCSSHDPALWDTLATVNYVSYEFKIARSGYNCFGVNDIDPQSDKINNVEVCNRCYQNGAFHVTRDFHFLSTI